MEHYWALSSSTSANVLQLESIRKIEIALYSGALPQSADGILYFPINLWATESPTTFISTILSSKLVQSAYKCIGSILPDLIAAHTLLWTCRNQQFKFVESES